MFLKTCTMHDTIRQQRKKEKPDDNNENDM